MKKMYTKPNVAFMELRPEEKLSLCGWPIGLMDDVCGLTDTWIDQPTTSREYGWCNLLLVNVLISGS